MFDLKTIIAMNNRAVRKGLEQEIRRLKTRLWTLKRRPHDLDTFTEIQLTENRIEEITERLAKEEV